MLKIRHMKNVIQYNRRDLWVRFVMNIVDGVGSWPSFTRYASHPGKKCIPGVHEVFCKVRVGGLLSACHLLIGFFRKQSWWNPYRLNRQFIESLKAYEGVFQYFHREASLTLRNCEKLKIEIETKLKDSWSISSGKPARNGYSRTVLAKLLLKMA